MQSLRSSVRMFRHPWTAFRCYSTFNSTTGSVFTVVADEQKIESTKTASTQVVVQEITDSVRVDAAAGTPSSLAQRCVYIYQASRNVMQSGLLHQNAETWRIDFDNGQARWENPLMGWTSSRDPVQAVVLKFRTREEATRYAERQGWTWTVREPHLPVLKPKSYSENFVYSPHKLKLIRTK